MLEKYKKRKNPEPDNLIDIAKLVDEKYSLNTRP